MDVFTSNESVIKRIPVGGSGVDLNLTEYRDILEQPEMERLNWVQQVPLAEERYVGCKHSRMEHSLGTYYYAKRLAEQLGLKRDDREALKISALVHDSGHPAFSHVTEFLLGKEHKERSAEIALKMKAIDRFADRKRVADIISNGNDELSNVLSSVLGADKLDYIERDMHHCGLGGGGIAEGVITYVLLKPVEKNKMKDYGVSYEGGSAVTDFLKMWWSAHKSIYLHPAVEIPRSMLQRAINYSFGPEDMDKLFEMRDKDVYSQIENGKDDDAKRLIRNLREGKHHIELVTFKLDGYKNYDSDPDSVYTITKEESDKIRNDLEYLSEKETELCKHFNVPRGSIIVTPSQDVERMDPDKKYCVIFMGKKMLTPVGEAYPDFAEYLREESKRHYAARMVVEKEYSPQISSKLEGKNPKHLFF
jgi:HD superfamily phosphohydrolase